MGDSISAAMCAAGRTLGDPRLSPRGDRVAFVANGAGGAVLMLVALEVGGAAAPEVALTSAPPLRSTAASGRGGFDWAPDGASVVYAGTDGTLYEQSAAGGPPRAVPGTEQAGCPAVSPDGTRVAYSVDDEHIVVAWLDGRRPPEQVSGEADFCLDPAWSPDSGRLAWHEWDVPNMPWDESRIALREIGGGSAPGHVGYVPLEAGVAVGSPRFSPDRSRLGFLCDATGWLNLWAAQADGADPRPVLDEPAEHGGPTWGGGARSWAWSPDATKIAFCRNENAFGRLSLLDCASGDVSSSAKGVHHSLSWAGRRLAALRSGPRVPDQVVVGGATGTRFESVARGPVAGFGGPDAAEPQPVTWAGQDVAGVGRQVHGRLWRASPSVERWARSPSPLAPLLLWVHGGPTDQHRVAFNPRLAFFLARGWNVLQVDPRGSTGWGRAYAQALRGRFGELDVEELASAVAAAKAEGWGDPSRMA
ncbi:MAG: S9 family peptidase, partial [Acidimicrobiales bacterium]